MMRALKPTVKHTKLLIKWKGIVGKPNDLIAFVSLNLIVLK